MQPQENYKEWQLILWQLRIGSNNTLVDWYNFVREVCLEISNLNNQKIGDLGEIVEIDESEFWKRKHNRGRRVNGCWVFGGIERGKEMIVVIDLCTSLA